MKQQKIFLKSTCWRSHNRAARMTDGFATSRQKIFRFKRQYLCHGGCSCCLWMKASSSNIEDIGKRSLDFWWWCMLQIDHAEIPRYLFTLVRIVAIPLLTIDDYVSYWILCSKHQTILLQWQWQPLDISAAPILAVPPAIKRISTGTSRKIFAFLR